MAVGLVVVSHSRALAEAAVALASEMISGDPPPIAMAAGMLDGGFGTDAVAVAEAIGEVDSGEGVVVLTDLGSAILSAELALEFLPDPDAAVRIVPAPFVEGLLAAAVSAGLGSDLETVVAEASGALGPKREQLGAEGPDATVPDPAAPDATAPDAVERSVVLVNPHGLHARPAAEFAAAVAATGLDVGLTVPGRAPVQARSPLALAGLGTRAGDTVTLSASGPGAAGALDALVRLIAGGFGEAEASAVAAPSSASPTGRGVGVSEGRVVGTVARPAPPLTAPDPVPPLVATERGAEAERIAGAARAVAGDLVERADAPGTLPEAAQILRATAALAQDPVLLEQAAAAVNDRGDAAERAVWDALDAVAQTYRQAGGLQAERVADVLDLRQRLVARLRGVPVPGLPTSPTPYILVAHDLAPADTAGLDRSRCLGLITEQGGPTSHTAILARALRIPAVVGWAGASTLADGARVLLDGGSGEVTVDPGAEHLRGARTEPEELTEAEPLTGPVRTRDGQAISVLANVGGPQDVARAAASSAQGVGLFRTEFCFLERADAPGEDEQAELYTRVLEGFEGHHVVLRTLDAGSDKPLPFLQPAREENPALGVRGLRIAWEHPDVLDTQLRAMARAARAVPGTEAWVMAPMVATADEAAWFAGRARAAGLGTAGVMIETPAAALCAAEILEQVDFVSLGTNDLTQYTMAADRQSAALAPLNDPWQPALLRLIEMIGAAGAAAGKSVGVCGEAAADPLLARVLMGLGVTSLSMNPAAVPGVGAAVQGASLEACREAAQASRSAGSPQTARAAARAILGG